MHRGPTSICLLKLDSTNPIELTTQSARHVESCDLCLNYIEIDYYSFVVTPADFHQPHPFVSITVQISKPSGRSTDPR